MSKTLTLVPTDPELLDWDLSPSYHEDFCYINFKDLKKILGEPNEEANAKSGGFPSWHFVLKGTDSRVTVYKHYSTSWHIGYNEQHPQAFNAMRMMLTMNRILTLKGIGDDGSSGCNHRA
jgi:hypothetical protein